MGDDYYSQKLNARRLRRAYEIASPRVRQYLSAEIDHLAEEIRPGERILEVGCGFGRVLGPLSRIAGGGWGIDTAVASIALAKADHPHLHLAVMDAATLGFPGETFDLVAGIQNFVSACRVPPLKLLEECLRVARKGGRVILSSYTAEFWPHRLEWFRRQAMEGLLGPIDEAETGNGVIACRDGFRAATFSKGDFAALAAAAGVVADIHAVDQSSLFCRISR
ncbi:MAG: class I SAM-dependent methyltransferase [Desulfobacterales bacterium]|jgi:2-polyprenyl-6-hydroxyphenyl methylase/3-demethylubiquinone-9 3-methyltransferase